MTKSPQQLLVISDTDLSRAWARSFLHILDNPGTEVTPLVMDLSCFDPQGQPIESTDIRDALDQVLSQMNNWDIETVAFTIFPQRYWRLAQGDRKKLFAIYRDVFPRLQAMNRRDNRRGLYFERLTMYGRGPCNGNQLEWILSQHHVEGGVRRSKFQATTFDPERDQVADARQGFPCLQHVTFMPTEAGLAVNAFYATQQIFDKAYGNYLGLAHLGAFMAHEMKIPMAKLNVTIGVAKLGTTTKTNEKLKPLVALLRKVAAATSAPQVIASVIRADSSIAA